MLLAAGSCKAVGVGGGKLLSPERRLRAVQALCALFRVSEQFVCRVVGQHLAPSAMAAKSSASRRPSCGDTSGRSRLSTSAGAGAWPTAC